MTAGLTENFQQQFTGTVDYRRLRCEISGARNKSNNFDNST
jgi:hypothetical protein